MMVVDLEGKIGDKEYLLTDPAIHCTDVMRFACAKTNLGPGGIAKFFQTHRCGELCKRILPPEELIES